MLRYLDIEISVPISGNYIGGTYHKHESKIYVIRPVQSRPVAPKFAARPAESGDLHRG